MTSFFYKHKPSGPFAVGIRDLSYLRGDELTPYVHLSARLFYPTSESRSLPTCFWLPHRLYAYGYTNSLLYPESFKGLKFSLMRGLLTALIYLLGATSGLYCSYDTALIPPETVTLQDVNGDADGKEAKEATEAPRQKLPVIIFSHGLTGNRNTYSSLCTELASRGYVVLAIEHADGSASATRLAGPIATNMPGVSNGWRFYSGWGNMETTYNRTRWRVKEVMTAYRLLESLAKGEDVPGLRLSGLTQSQQSQFLSGRLDMGRTSVMGHSYGGATAAMAASEHPELRAAVALDPWWQAMPPESSALNRKWPTQSPLLVLGSQDWNTPTPKGTLYCGKEEQEAVLAAAAAGSGTKAGTRGPGALLLVPRGSTHHSFDDVLLFFGGMIAPVLRLFKFHAQMPPERALDISVQATDHFLQQHLPAKSSSPLPLKSADTDAYKKMIGADLFSCTEAYA